jgi:hypothetical protein
VEFDDEGSRKPQRKALPPQELEKELARGPAVVDACPRLEE